MNANASPQLNRPSVPTGPNFTRRELLRWTAAGSAACLAGPLAAVAGPAPAGGPSIDAHVHVWTPDTTRYPLAPGFRKVDMQPASFTPEELMAHARPCGVERIVLIQMSYYGFDNSYMLEVIRQHPRTYSGVAVIDEHRQPEPTMRELATQGVRGFRIYPGKTPADTWLKSEGLQSMWRCGAETGLAMCHLINPEYLPAVDAMCQKHPDTPVVIDHFARIGIDGQIRERDLDQLCRLARHRLTAVKVSAFYALGKKEPPYHDLAPMIRRVLDAFGPERLMWASDCPFQVDGKHTYAASIDLVRGGLEFLSPGDRQWLLGKTAERVFFR